MAKKNNTKAAEAEALATVERASLIATSNVIDFSGDAAEGLEGADAKSFAIPFVAVLQSNSPQVEDKTVPGAEAGLFFNNITNAISSEVLLIPCAYNRRYNRWTPREKGGGFKGDYDPALIDTGKLEGLEEANGQFTVDGDYLKDTRNHYVLVSFDGGDTFGLALFSLTSTQLKKSKRWMSLIRGIELHDSKGKAFNPASYSHVYKATTVKESNDKGKWYGVNIELVGPLGDPEVYAKAKAFNHSVRQGEVEATPPQPDDAEPTEGKAF